MLISAGNSKTKSAFPSGILKNYLQKRLPNGMQFSITADREFLSELTQALLHA